LAEKSWGVWGFDYWGKIINHRKAFKQKTPIFIMVLNNLNEAASGLLLGGIVGGLIAIGIIVAVLVFLAVYIYFAAAWKTIAEKLKYKDSWLAWIPFANLAMILQLGGFHWAWVFLLVIPFLGWIAFMVLCVIATWRIFERLNYPGWFSLSIIIPQIGLILYLIAIGFAAWGGKRKTDVKKIKRR